jgi:uncharacterized membrane protein
MAELDVIGFDNPFEADRVLTDLRRMPTEYLVELEDAVVAVRGPDGKPNIKQGINLVGPSALSGGIWGGLFGTLIGLLFLNPLLGFGLGAAMGAGSGALSGSLVDYGINDDFIRRLATS